MKKYKKRRTSRKPALTENSPHTGSKRREQSVYFGQQLLGTFIENERSGLFLAWDSQRRFLGRFQAQREAANAISEAARAAEARRAAAAEALEYVNRATVEFASGMPEHFLWRRP
jgi:hypothetical protein